MRFDVLLIRGETLQSVVAQLVPLTGKHLDDYETAWNNRLQQSGTEDALTDWDFKKRVFIAKGEAEGYAIEFEDMTQGMMVLRVRGRRSSIEPNRRIVYVSRLATAPWNRSEVQNPITFKLVGTALLQFAQFRSRELGYGGLVGVHALPSAEVFYSKLGLLDCGLDEEAENLRYFEWYFPRPSPFDEIE
jgi:hypothetical protein